MNSTLNTATGSPEAVLAARADERLTHAYEQIALADEQLARVTEKLSNMERGSQRRPAAVSPPQPSRDRPALRGLVGLLLAGCIGGAAFASQSSGIGRSMISQWAPSFVPASPRAKSEDPAPSAPPLQLAAVETTSTQPTSSSAQPTPSAQTPAPSQDAASPPASISPELVQALQAMARDIATLQHGVEQLRANQDRMAADNARAIEQLRASREQATHLAVAKPVEKPVEPSARSKPPAPAPQAVANTARKPPQPPAQAKPSQAQARARSQPIQLQPDDQ
jgi:hypothetical protein